ncbi:hypothetical protein BGZ73_001361 [Actinomortierella ambigua]|nr:hypothetical protein BGZ73_001361 [Actinomortierella ambigua]
MKFSLVIATLAAVATVASAALPVQPPSDFALREDQMREQQVVGNHKPLVAPAPAGVKSYIVVFKESAAAHVIEAAIRDIESFGGKIGQRYSSALKGFAAKIPSGIISALSTNPFIDYIEEDGEVTTYA